MKARKRTKGIISLILSLIMCVSLLPAGTFAAESAEISSVKVVGIRRPVIGMTVEEMNSRIGCLADSNYTISEKIWWENGVPMKSGDTFNDHSLYHYNIYLAPKDGYYFPYGEEGSNDSWNIYTGTVTSSDYTHKYAEVLTKVDSKHTGDLVISSDREKALAAEEISNVSVYGISQPYVGQTVGEVNEKINIPAGSHYTISEILWWEDGRPLLPETATFNANSEYHCSVYLKPDKGYAFLRV